MNRVPINGVIRTKWMERISEHQADIVGYFTICAYHFKKDEFSEENGQKCLMESAIPSVFSTESSEICDQLISERNDSVDGDIHELAEIDDNANEVLCKSCINLNIYLLSANEEIFKLEKKNSILKKSVANHQDELKNIRKENTELKKVISEFNSAIKVCQLFNYKKLSRTVKSKSSQLFRNFF